MNLSPQKKFPRTLSLALLAVTGSFLAAGQYSIDWFKVAGGGSMSSTGGVYSVSGTIGQPEAGGPMTNGQYSVTGGFWVLPEAVQVAGAPLLKISPASPGSATISWTPDATGWVLQENANLGSTNWINSASGGSNPAIVPTALSRKFYRLHKP